VTTKHSPVSALKAQAEKIAATIKAAERGEKIDVRFAEKIAAARDKDIFKVGIFMDDKVITIEMPWAVIKGASEAGLAEFILKQMCETNDTIQ